MRRNQEIVKVLGYKISEKCDMEKVNQIKNSGTWTITTVYGELNWIRKFFPGIQKHMMILSTGLKSKVGEINVTWTDRLRARAAHDNILKKLKNPIEFNEYKEVEVVNVFTDAG